jgi:hypothetical protein
MISFLAAVPELIIWGCGSLIIATIIAAFRLKQQSGHVNAEIAKLSSALKSVASPVVGRQVL